MAITLIKNPDQRNDPPRPLLEHLMALRDMLIFAAISWIICVIVCGCLSRMIFHWLQSPMAAYAQSQADQAGLLAARGPVDGVSVGLQIAFWGGTALSFPFTMFAILRFVFPALTKREKVVLLTILVIGTGFFISGTVLAYAKTLPMVVSAFQAINAWVGLPVTTIRIEGYISIVLKTIIAFGLVFQLPVILFVLGWFGLISSKALREKRRIAIVVSFALSMFLTPPDPMSQIVMAVPLCLLYELSTWAVWLKEKGSRSK